MAVGTDIVKISRVKKLMAHERFFHRLFTPVELEYMEVFHRAPETAAGLFAAKEAISKVLGTGIGKVNWKDIEIIHAKSGKPSVYLHGEAVIVMRSLGFQSIQVSISHEKEYAIAVAASVDSKTTRTDNYLIDPDMVEVIRERKVESHKGDYGRIGILGGSIGMCGAPYLSSMGALRTGSGLVYVMVPGNIATIMQIKSTEGIVRPIHDGGKGCFIKESLPYILSWIENLDALAIGPGMGKGADLPYILEIILKEFKKPIIIDADGINALSQKPEILKDKSSPIVITPHAMELSRLSKIPVSEINTQRIETAIQTAERYDMIVLLKGHETIIADAKSHYLNHTGNPGMATAGSGDVLTGVVVSLLGQSYPPVLAARLAAHIHGLAGDMVRQEMGDAGMIATDILTKIPRAIQYLKENKKNDR